MLNPEWYHDDAQSAFVAFADGESGCSRYDFDEDGVAIRRSPVRRPGPFAETYRAELRSMNRIGALTTHLNIHDALRRGRLSDLVVSELRRNSRTT
jgi:hypothetical protein